MFIAIEGINGCGKTTVCSLLEEKLTTREKDPLRPEDIVVMRNPSASPIGMEIRRYLRDARSAGFPMFFTRDAEDFARRLAILFIADRLVMQAELDAHLAADHTVICDRYSVSTLVYQCAMIGDVAMTSGLADMIREAHKGIIVPDHTFILDTPVDVARRRLANRGEDVDDLMTAPIEHAARAMYYTFSRTNVLPHGERSLMDVGYTHVLEVGAPEEIVDLIEEETANIF